MGKQKGKNYTYFEECYIENNYPYIPINIEFSYSEYDKANKLDCSNLIGIYEISEEKDCIRGYCLNKDLNKVSRILKLNHDLTGEDSGEYLSWLHDCLMDEFGDMEVEKGNYFEWFWNIDFMNKIREDKVHRVIHFIMDNIDKYCGYFINTDCGDYEWLYALYDDAKDGYVDSKYKVVEVK